MNYAFFDMDDTLMHADSNELLFGYLRAHDVVDEAYLAPFPGFARQFYEGVLKIDDFVRYVLRPFTNMPAAERTALLRDCVETLIAPRVYPKARETIAWHRERGHGVVVVSASVDFLVAEIARVVGITEIIAAPSARGDGDVVTGDLAGMVPYQKGKVVRIEEFLRARGITLEESYGYGDSVNDLDMLKFCTHRYAVNPSPELRAHPDFKLLTECHW